MLTFIICGAVLIIALVSAVVLWAGNQPGHRRCTDKFFDGEDKRSDNTKTDPFGRPFFRKTVK